MKKTTVTLILFMVTSSSVSAAGFEVLKPHRAVYEVKLERAEDRSGIKNMSGRIVYEVNGNECEGMSIQYRFVTRISTGRDTFITDQQTSTHESPDGKEFSFQTKSFVNDQPDQKIVGNAAREASGLRVELGQGEKRELMLDDAIFTSSHLIEILKGAQSGQPFLSHNIFDGSGDADEVLNSSSVIGKARQLADLLTNENQEAVSTLLDQEAWPVTMSYFNRNIGNTGEGTPIYEASFFLYPDGVTRQLKMSYPDYSLLASLSELEYFDPSPC